MRLLYPSLFWIWAALIAVPIVLYLFRPRPRTVRTSTLPFFKWLAREHQDSAWLRWLKHLLSLLISILVILGAAAALGRLVVAPEAESLKTVVILVDRSASMGAAAEDGTSRLEEAVRLLGDRLAGLPAATGVIVMAYDRRPEVLLSRSMDHRRVSRALASIEARPVEGDPHTAVQLARRLAELEPPAGIWHATDAVEPAGEQSPATADEQATAEDAPADGQPDSGDSAVPDAAEVPLAADIAVDHLCVALKQPINVGVTALKLRRPPQQRARFEAFVQIHCAAPGPLEAELETVLDGELVEIRRLPLSPGGREKLLIPVEPKQDSDRVLRLAVSAAGDVLAADDVVEVRVPSLRPVRVLWISQSPDPFTELALTSVGSGGDLDVLQGPPSAWPPEEPVDVAIFDNWLPEAWPQQVPAIVINPPGPLGPVKAVRIQRGGLFLQDMRAPDPGHPLLYGVATARVGLAQTAVLAAEGPLEPVWVGSQGPVLAAGESGGRRLVVMGFSPQHSERLPLMASYPMLIGNAIYWAAESEIESTRGFNRRTGELIELEGTTLTFKDPGGGDAAETTRELTGRSVELDRIGLWETDAGETGSASLLSAADTLVPALGEDAAGAARQGDAAGAFRGDLAPILLWGVLALLVVESWLFHRYMAY